MKLLNGIIKQNQYTSYYVYMHKWGDHLYIMQLSP